jgi:hypothetical protein
MLAIQGILTALIARAASGQGQRVDASLLNGMLFAHTARLSVFHETGEPLPRYGSGHPEIVPYQAFHAADGWLFVAAWVDRLWLPFCKAVGMDALFIPGSPPRRPLAHRGARGDPPRCSARPVTPDGRSSRPTLCALANDYPCRPAPAGGRTITEQSHPRAGTSKTAATR